MNIEIGEILLSAPSYQDVVAQLGSEDTFFQCLANFDDTTRLTIYATDADLTTIAYKWLKALLRNADLATAYAVVTLVYKRFEYVYGYPYNSTVKLSSESAARYKALGASLPSFTDFCVLWNDTVPFDLSVQGYEYFSERCSVEFQLAAYFASGGKAFAGILERKLVPMVRK
jgi:hypothetical protein